ncbi:pleckstrin homology-like domain family B member1 [Striga asiatica]|uniref:Pleckstrin homology-like domain family B member1 n=1 Tax=Striga asiatica TaxID=4170 RepID=A0A5A7RJP2_STRAF|nr:pleckstrin homology-like domain family B member1 [Striga asiatica]
MADNVPNSLTDGTATFDPGDENRRSSHESEFPVLDRNALSASKRPKICKRAGEPLEKQSPPTQQQSQEPNQEPQPRKWSFKDMVNKQRQHVDMVLEDDGKGPQIGGIF